MSKKYLTQEDILVILEGVLSNTVAIDAAEPDYLVKVISFMYQITKEGEHITLEDLKREAEKAPLASTRYLMEVAVESLEGL
jgi:hypothetical protein